jgi:hypothetical protein
VTATGGSAARTIKDRAADVFNIADYGAKCDGTTNDNAAINAAVAAAAASTAYTNNNSVAIVGPQGSTQKGCLINSINLTQFQRGTGANLRPRVTLRDMTLLCTGAGNVCIDALASSLIKLQNISVRGDNVSPPAICIQIGMIDGVSRAWHSFDHVNCNNEFTFAAFYNFGSESVLFNDSMFSNVHSASGPIGALGALTAGSGYVNNQYTNVPLTGGSGAGALATIVVNANAVLSVKVTYEGKGYKPGDVLSAAASSLGGAGSGFSIPVSTVRPYAVVMDGQNHWRASSAYVTQTLPTDTWQSLTLVTFLNSHVRQQASGGALWLGWTGGFRMVNSYILNSTGDACVDIYDNGVTKVGIPGPNWGLDLEFNCEGSSLTSMITLKGGNATPVLQGVRYSGYHLSPGATFRAASDITAVTMRNADINLKFADQSGTPMFASAKLWTMSGRVTVPTAANWNAPESFSGDLIVGSLATPPRLGPVDVLPGAATAASCARQLSRSYSGPLCQVQRASDSATMDLYANTNGDLDPTGAALFCANTTCAVSVLYDQSGNGNNFTQSTAASQPSFTRSLTALGGRAALGFTEAGPQAMSAAAAAPINDLFATGGYVSLVANQTGNANVADRLLYKGNGGTVGFDLRSTFVGTGISFTQNASGGQSTWTTASVGLQRVMDVQYSSASLSNVPVLGFNGQPQTLTQTLTASGTISSDAAFPLLLGNNATTGGTRGFPGYIAEVVAWKTTPTAAQLEAVRRNQAAYYGVANVN